MALSPSIEVFDCIAYGFYLFVAIAHIALSVINEDNVVAEEVSS